MREGRKSRLITASFLEIIRYRPNLRQYGRKLTFVNGHLFKLLSE